MISSMKAMIEYAHKNGQIGLEEFWTEDLNKALLLAKKAGVSDWIE